MAKKVQYHFVLSKEEADSDLRKQMDTLKGQKQLSAKLKTALALLLSLEQGDTSLLDSMFPTLRKPEAPPTPDTSGMELKLDRIEKWIIEREGVDNIIPADAPMVAMNYGSPPVRQLSAHTEDDFTPPPITKLPGLKKGSAPIFEPPPDEGDTLVITKTEGDMTATMNFLASFGGLLGTDIGAGAGN